MKSRIKFTLLLTLFGLMGSLAQAGFTSIHVFGDGLSCTATNPSAGQYYYGKRYSNGRVWVEVLAQMQGLPFDPVKNTHAYFGNTSGNLYAETVAYTPPADASNALVVIWVNNADLYYPAEDPLPTQAKFNNTINLAMASQFKAITNLYTKGIRTLVMPNVVDISTIPEFNAYILYTGLFHQASVNYNTAFYAMLDRARAACPNLNIVVPDYYTLLTNLLSHPSDYGVVNPLLNQGSGLLGIDALENPLLLDKSLNGPGASYIFWDSTDPTAKVHYIMASIAQQLVSPVQIGLTPLGVSNRIDMINAPVGMNGFVDGCTNLSSGWTITGSFTGTSPAQSLFVQAPVWPQYTNTTDYPTNVSINPGGGGGGGSTTYVYPPPTSQFYRLRFPYSWVWP